LNIIVIWLLVGLGLFCLSVIGLLIVIFVRLGKRKNVHGIIFMKSGGQKKLKFNRETETSKSINGETYNLVNDCIVKTPFKDFIYYMEGNPNPLKYDFNTMKPEMVALELKTILKNDLVQKLFSDDTIDLIKLLVIINLIITAIILIISAIGVFGGGGVNLKQSPENYALIYNATKQAIMGL
jgi:hypothetical protein